MDLSALYPSRAMDVRKGDFGRVVIAGGSERYAGCLAFNALGALRGGADLALVVAPRRAADIVGHYSPDLITIPCDMPFPDPAMVSELIDEADALVVGGGMARTPGAHRAVLSIIRACGKPMVADAEALHAIAAHPEVLHGKRALLTPHPGEYGFLAGETWPKGDGPRRTAVRALASRHGATVIVKGGRDYVSDGAHVYVDQAGSPYLTKGGYGDLLAGVAGALLARGRTPLEAARAAALIVGLAGEAAAKDFGEGTLASDALDRIPGVLPPPRARGADH